MSETVPETAPVIDAESTQEPTVVNVTETSSHNDDVHQQATQARKEEGAIITADSPRALAAKLAEAQHTTSEEPTGDPDPAEVTAPSNDNLPPEPPEVIADISTLTEGRFETPEALYEHVQSMENQEPTGFEPNEFYQGLEEVLGYDPTAEDFSDYLAVQSANFDEMEGIDVIHELMLMQDPDTPQSELDSLTDYFAILDYDVEDLIEEGETTRIEYNKIKSDYDRQSRTARLELKEAQDNWSIADDNPDRPQRRVASAENSAEMEQRAAEWQEAVTGAMNSGDKEKFSYSYEDNGQAVSKEVEFSLEGADRNALEHAMSNVGSPEKLFQQYIGSDGSVDMAGLKNKLTLLLHGEKIIKATASRAFTEGQQSMLKRHKNIPDSLGTTPRLKAQPSDRAAVYRAAAALRKGG